MQSISSRIWTRVAVSVSCDDKHYTTDTSNLCVYGIKNALEKSTNKSVASRFLARTPSMIRQIGSEEDLLNPFEVIDSYQCS